jgi:hypothetical protein
VKKSRKRRVLEGKVADGRCTLSVSFFHLSIFPHGGRGRESFRVSRRGRDIERHRGRKGAMLKPERLDWIRSRVSDFVMYKKSK